MSFLCLPDGVGLADSVISGSHPLALRRLGNSGPPVILVHGIGRCGALWWPIAEALACSHRVVMVDNPGIAGSRHLPVPRTIDEHARLYAETLENAGFHEPVHLVGLSLGGMIVCALAAQLGERCASLSVLASSCRESAFWRLSPPGVLRILGRLLLLKPRHAATIPGLVSRETRERHPTLVQDVTAIDRMQGRRAGSMLRQLLAANRFRLRSLLDRLPATRQVIVGSGDALVPMFNSQRLAALLKTDLHILEGRGHDLALDGGDELVALIAQIAS